MRVYRRALSYFWQDRGWVLLLLGLVALSDWCLRLLYVWPMAVLLDVVLTTTPHRTWIHNLFLAPFPDNKLAQVIGMAGLGMAIKIAQDTIGMLRIMINNK